MRSKTKRERKQDSIVWRCQSEMTYQWHNKDELGSSARVTVMLPQLQLPFASVIVISE
jgi:hypothetical protein